MGVTALCLCVQTTAQNRHTVLTSVFAVLFYSYLNGFKKSKVLKFAVSGDWLSHRSAITLSGRSVVFIS